MGRLRQKVTLSWDSVTDATGYTVKRATTAGGSYTTIASDVMVQTIQIQFFDKYVFGYNAAYGYWKFNLKITNDSLVTPYVNSSSSIWENSYDFKEDIQNADQYIENTIFAGMGLYPPAGVGVFIGTTIDKMDDGMTPNEIATSVLSLVECVYGVGTIIAIADFCANASLAAAELFNARQEFRNVKNSI